jgi:hypothetical protein
VATAGACRAPISQVRVLIPASMTKRYYTKVFGIRLKAWQYEILGCTIFYLIGFFGISIYLTSGFIIGIIIPSIILLVIGILSPINVYLKEQCGYYDMDYQED